MTATFVSVSFQQSDLFLRCPLLPLHPPAATQLMFSQAHRILASLPANLLFTSISFFFQLVLGWPVIELSVHKCH